MTDFQKYIRQPEPGTRRRAEAWRTAIGLQDVDGLKVSPYLIQEAERHIEGDATIEDVRINLNEYYRNRDAHSDTSSRQEEADRVAANIVKLLGEDAFVFSPAGLASVHRRIFEGVLAHAGKFRTYNITKPEWVLDGDTVLYGIASEITPTLEYDFGVEKQTRYVGMSPGEIVKNIARFTSGIWQIHPFCEGNTRATAVFIIKYLRTLGFNVTNDMFAGQSFNFRNALVRTNYTNVPKGISSDTGFLEQFFRNLLLGEDVAIRNRDMHISNKPEET